MPLIRNNDGILLVFFKQRPLHAQDVALLVFFVCLDHFLAAVFEVLFNIGVVYFLDLARGEQLVLLVLALQARFTHIVDGVIEVDESAKHCFDALLFVPQQLLQLVRKHLVYDRQVGRRCNDRIRAAEIILEGGLKTKEQFALARLRVVELYIRHEATVLLPFDVILNICLFYRQSSFPSGDSIVCTLIRRLIILKEADVAEENEIGDRHVALAFAGQQSVWRQDVKLEYLFQVLLPLLGLQVD